MCKHLFNVYTELDFSPLLVETITLGCDACCSLSVNVQVGEAAQTGNVSGFIGTFQMSLLHN